MLNKMTKMALLGALILGTASAAQASNDNDGGNETGGYVLPGSMDGVNPVYHLGIFGNAHAARAYDFAPLSTGRHVPSRAKSRHGF